MERARKRQRQSSPTANSHSKKSLQSGRSRLSEASKSPVSRSLTPPRRWPGRQFHRHVSRAPVSPEACQKILTSFDYEKSYCEQPDSVMSELEKVMGFEGWPFVDEHDRARIIRDKAHNTLAKFLWSHRYYWLTSTSVDGKPRLIISPKEGVTPLPFPDWFSTPYVVRVSHQDFSYKPESGKEICENSTITSGHGILDLDHRRVGTYSCLMNTTRSPQNHQLTWICPTAGHTIDDLASELIVMPHNTAEPISLAVATMSIRVFGRPRHSVDNDPSFRDDVAFLAVKESDLHAFQRAIPNINPFYLITNAPDELNILDPVSFSRYYNMERIVQTSQLIVYKYGSSTDLTAGRLVELTRRPPQGWYGSGDGDDLETEMDDDEWIGVVDWIGFPFSSPGDSGSLVFAIENGIYVPLGIHVGSPDNEERSYFISIETFCFIAETEGWEVRFAVS